jgi:hypothetical protein
MNRSYLIGLVIAAMTMAPSMQALAQQPKGSGDGPTFVRQPAPLSAEQLAQYQQLAQQLSTDTAQVCAADSGTTRTWLIVGAVVVVVAAVVVVAVSAELSDGILGG